MAEPNGDIRALYVQQARIETMLQNALKELAEAREERAKLRQLLEEKYVTKDDISPLQKAVFGTGALIVTAVVSALLALVLGAAGAIP